jgi:endonuclease/exonuclease/phosphatase family metal-dependent hydrolase
MTPLRVVSINTGKGDGPYRRRVELLGSGLSALDPDLVLLQEAIRSSDGRLDTAQSLASYLRLRSEYIPARFKVREIEGTPVECWSGMGLLTRRAPDTVTRVVVPQDERDGERVALVARFGDLAIANLHLTHLRDAQALRRRQVETLLAAEPLCSARHAIIGGDFNTRLEEIRELLAGIGRWRAIDAFGDGTQLRATVPVDKPMRAGYCLDYIFALVRDNEPAPRFRGSSIVLDDPDSEGVHPSDHRGIMTTVRFNELEQRA